MSYEQASRWCLRVTWDEYLDSRRAGRPISRPNLIRLMRRRCRDALRELVVCPDALRDEQFIRQALCQLEAIHDSACNIAITSQENSESK